MENWLRLEQDFLKAPKKQKQEGNVKFTLYFSPNDVPAAVRGSYKPQSKTFVIEFKYLGEEPLREHKADQRAVFFLGKNSSRLYRIDFRLPENAKVADYPKLVVREIRHLPSADKNDSYTLAKKVILDRGSELFRDLPQGQLASAY